MASSFRRRKAKPGGQETPPSNTKEGEATPSPSSSSSLSSLSSPPTSRLAGLRGTKLSWASSGVSLTSTGLADLDAILGGGQPLGTCLWLILDDRAQSSLSSCLLQYWCAEALSHDHHLLVPVLEGAEEEGATAHTPSPWVEAFHHDDEEVVRTTNPRNRHKILRLLRSLPRNRHYPIKRDTTGGDKDPHKEEAWNELTTLQEDGEDGDAEVTLDEHDDDLDDDVHHPDDSDVSRRRREAEAEENLKIAWQYSKAEQRKRHGVAHRSSKAYSGSRGDHFCHKYDLSGQWSDAEIPSGLPAVPEEEAVLPPIVLDHSKSHREAGYAFFLQLCAHVQALLVNPFPRVIRLLLYVPDDDHSALGALSIALPLFLAHVRSESLPVVVLVATAASLLAGTTSRHLATSMLRLHRTSDAVLEVENFASRREYPPPAEFRHLHGLFKVRRAATQCGATATGASAGHFADWTVPKRPNAFLYGLKRNHRSLSIPMLHIPPEDYAEGGGSVAAGGVRTGAGRPKEKPSLGCATSGGQGGGGTSGVSFDF